VGSSGIEASGDSPEAGDGSVPDMPEAVSRHLGIWHRVGRELPRSSGKPANPAWISLSQFCPYQRPWPKSTSPFRQVSGMSERPARMHSGGGLTGGGPFELA